MSKHKVYISSLCFKVFFCKFFIFSFGVFLHEHHCDNCVQKKSDFNKSVSTELKGFILIHHNLHFRWQDSKPKNHTSKHWRLTQHGTHCMWVGFGCFSVYFWEGGMSLLCCCFQLFYSATQTVWESAGLSLHLFSFQFLTQLLNVFSKNVWACHLSKSCSLLCTGLLAAVMMLN